MHYVEYMEDSETKAYIERNLRDYVYSYTPDVLVLIDDAPVVEIECKAYTENAMLKRILVDATLTKQRYPHMKFVLFQLESQLGGDFSELREKTLGSPSTHTLLSYFDVDLHIVTLLKGERKVDQPIHKKRFFKPLTKQNLELAITHLVDVLKESI
jgi:hypothetical protein